MIFSTEYQQRTNIKYIKNFTTHHYNRDKHLNRNNKQKIYRYFTKEGIHLAEKHVLNFSASVKGR